MTFIGSTSLTDAEFASIDAALTSAAYDVETYEATLAVIEARESVSTARDRLRYYFLARGVSIEALSGQSNILIGGSECE